MSSIIAKTEDGTITLTITVPAAEVKKQREVALEHIAQAAKVPGFRKGKAPKKIVEEKVDEQAIQEEIIQHLVPRAYPEALKEHNLRPIVNPQLHIEKYRDGEDLVFQAIVCEMPEIDLGNYKEEVKKATAGSKIIVPGKEPKVVSFEDIVRAIMSVIKIKVPRVILDQETQRLLAQTLDEVKRLGLTLDQYLASTGKNVEDLRRDYEEKARLDVSVEFALQKIAENEKITVEEKEIEEAVVKAKDDTERKALESNRYLLAQILRQQKTLDFLRNL